MAEMKSLTLNGTTYDSFVDKEARADLENLEPGADGGYYTPTVTQTGENTVKFSFTASKEEMAAVADQNITLPAGYTPVKGVDYFTDAEKQEIAEQAAELVEVPESNNALPGIVSVKDFGAKGDGVTDDATAIQNAINSLPTGGGTVYFPAGVYMISKAINIGNGNGGGTASTRTAIKLVGASNSRVGANPAVQITPSTKIGVIFKVNGSISNVTIDGFQLYCNGLADFGLHMTAVTKSEFRNIDIYNPCWCGLGIYGGGAPTGNYNIHNKFTNISVQLATSGTIGLDMDGDYSVSNDTWLSLFELCRFESLGNTTNCTSAKLGFVDSITFQRCHFVTYSSTGRGIEFTAIGHNGFPCGIGFYDCSIINTVVTESTTEKIRKNYFVGYGTYDNEQIPTHSSLVGITDTGKPFNGWGTA